MDTYDNKAIFVRHSFQRLTNLIQKQNFQHFMSSISNNKSIDNDKNPIHIKADSITKRHRSYVRPPKTRSNISYRCSSSDLSINSKQSLNESPVYVPHHQTLYERQLEKDLQNDIRRKYDIPQPFQREWLRQPRYIPQERPSYT